VTFTLEYGPSDERRAATATVKIMPVAQDTNQLTVEHGAPTLRTAKRTTEANSHPAISLPAGP
jgi:hypothetical protein